LSQSINIVSFDVPFPANYGGVIDVYYKLVALNKAGVKIHLHCFQYGRSASKELENLCERVFYYQRKTSVINNFSLIPYTVKSRQSTALEKNLLSNNFPILFEVLHTCYLLSDARFKNREKIYRHSNIEHDYYLELSRSEKNLLKKLYLKIEAWKLKRFEKILKHADLIFAVNQKDANYFEEKFPTVLTSYIPSFHQNESISIEKNSGDFILYHGNLSVSENYEAALWLTENVFSKINHKVIIAGLNPPDFLKENVSQYSNIQLIENPDDTDMNRLISAAQIHVLFTSQDTGLKLKLLNVLYHGRFIICNLKMLAGTGLKNNSTLLMANYPSAYIQQIENHFNKIISEKDITERAELLEPFNNQKNSSLLLNEIFRSV
jgi:hypothetical protein